MNIIRIEMQSHCLAELRTFYIEKLGLQLLDDSQDRFTVKAGRSSLQFSAAPAGEQPAYHFAFNIPENQLSEGLEWIRKRVSILRSADGTEVFDFSNWNAHAFYFRDPAGNILECIARHSLTNAGDLPFSATSLLSISEIGLPVTEPLAVCARISKELGIPAFSRSIPSSQFAAMGDDEGLLIVVPPDKKWMPADDQVKRCRMKVMMKGKHPATLLEGEAELQVVKALAAG